MFAKMVIGECLSEAEVREFSKIYETDVTAQLVEERGYAGSQVLIEEGRNMVISLTTWKTRGIVCATLIEELPSVRLGNSTPSRRQFRC